MVDASTGVRWVLVKDAAHPAGPGRLIADRSTLLQRQVSTLLQRQVLIRAGDWVLVEEHTENVDLRLEAVALSPAAVGCVFAVRLRIGGKVTQARAVAPGRAELAAEGKWR
jgi:flagella basal body P-ring formation protein FlgA